jgi:hypothetical protein
MPNTYTQIHIQTIFAVQNRQSLIQKEWQEELYKYITGMLNPAYIPQAYTPLHEHSQSSHSHQL